MVRALLLFLLFSFLLRAALRFLNGIVQGATGAGTSRGQASRPAPPQAVKMAQCPVCGTYVVPGKALSSVHGGRTVYFDSDECRRTFGQR
jgi:YHS domain-containing protein